MEDEPVSKGRLSVAALAAVVAGLVVPALGLAVAYRSCLGTTVRGAVALKGGGVDWHPPLDSCSAEADGHAVVLDGGGPPVVRVVLDPIDGTRVEVTPPDRPVIALTPATCPGLVVTLRATDTRSDGSAIVDGSFELACTVPAGHPLAGAAITADGWWKSCKFTPAS